MKNTSKLIFFLIAICFSSILKAEVQVEFSRNSVQVGEVFDIRFIDTSNTNSNSGSNPDFSPLSNDFEVFNTSQSLSSSFQIINGVSSQQSRRIYTLTVIAKNSGIITLPAISFGAEKSRPHVIQVMPNSALASDNFFIEIEASPKEAFVFEQFMISYVFYHSESLTRPNFIYPEIKGVEANIETLNQENGQIQKNGRTYGFVRQKFLITAKQSGTLSISPFAFSGFLNTSRGVRVFEQSDPININIKSIPNGVDINHWFPAKNIKLNQNFSGLSDEIELGSPIIREIELNAQSVGNNQSPVFEFKAGIGFSVYEDKMGIERNETSLQAKQRFTVIPSQTGEIEIPEFKFHWWDLNSNQMQTSTLAAKKIKVIDTKNIGSSNNQNNQTLEQDRAQSPDNQLKTDNTNKQDNSINYSNNSDNFWLISTLIFLVVISSLFSIYLGFKLRNIKQNTENKEKNNLKNDSDLAESQKIKMAEKLLLEIKENLKNNNLNNARLNLSQLAKIFISKKIGHTQFNLIDELDQMLGEDFSNIRKQIDANLYNNENKLINIDLLAKSIENFLSQYKKNLKNKKSHSLAKL